MVCKQSIDACPLLQYRTVTYVAAAHAYVPASQSVNGRHTQQAYCTTARRKRQRPVVLGLGHVGCAHLEQCLQGVLLDPI